MDRFEYRVIPAPRRGEKARGVKSSEDRFAHALTGALNQMAGDGWDFVRADTLPCDERSGLTGRTTHYHAMLVFRRPLAGAGAQPYALQAAEMLPPDRGTALRAAREDEFPLRSAAPRLGPADRLADDDLAAE